MYSMARFQRLTFQMRFAVHFDTAFKIDTEILNRNLKNVIEIKAKYVRIYNLKWFSLPGHAVPAF